ncbi:MAG: SIMPL domain-containing protein [Patescibacteria group bacterium]
MQNCCEHKKSSAVFKTIIAVFILSLTALVLTYTQAKLDQSTNTISVSGIGEIYAKPDLALTSFSVVTEGKTVDEALTANTEKMNTVIENIKNLGVEEKDLKTTNFNIDPQYEWETDFSSLVWPRPEKRVLAGYKVTQSLQVKIRDLTKVGEIIQTATDAGSNQVGNLQFTIDNEDELKIQARELAIKNAKIKAEELSSQLGVRLVKIVSFSESSSYAYSREIYSGLEKAYDSATSVLAPQIETGENKIEANVYITYQIN